MAKLSIDDLNLDGKRVLTRVDFNVPIEDGRITDDTRIRAAIPTIDAICRAGGIAVLMSHFGRPKGSPDPAYSLRPVADHLRGRIDHPVTFCEDTVGSRAESVVSGAAQGSVVLLENTRFHAGETANDPEFSAQLAALGDVYVNDAFGAAHRAHASTVGITEHLQPAAMGYLLKREIETLARLLADPERPFVAVLGGAKVSDKLGVIRSLLDHVDRLLIGGAMAYTFMKAVGQEVGQSKVEEDLLGVAAELYEEVSDVIVLPTDHIVAEAFDNDADHGVITGGFEEGMGLDIGPATREHFRDLITAARTVLWNGPMGVFEMPSFAEGTLAVAHAMADATANNDAETVVGGGDSVAAATQAGLETRISHVSTGGGAMLEFIEGQDLPGIAALTER